MPTRIREFEVVVNDGTPIVPEWLSDLPNKVQFSVDGCSSDRFVIMNLEQPLDSQRWGGRSYASPIFDELEFWLDGQDEPTFLMLLLSHRPELRDLVVGAFAGRYVGNQQIVQTYLNAETDVAAALHTLTGGMMAKGFLVDAAPASLLPVGGVPECMDFRA